MLRQLKRLDDAEESIDYTLEKVQLFAKDFPNFDSVNLYVQALLEKGKIHFEQNPGDRTILQTFDEAIKNCNRLIERARRSPEYQPQKFRQLLAEVHSMKARVLAQFDLPNAVKEIENAINQFEKQLKTSNDVSSLETLSDLNAVATEVSFKTGDHESGEDYRNEAILLLISAIEKSPSNQRLKTKLRLLAPDQ